MAPRASASRRWSRPRRPSSARSARRPACASTRRAGDADRVRAAILAAGASADTERAPARAGTATLAAATRRALAPAARYGRGHRDERSASGPIRIRPRTDGQRRRAAGRARAFARARADGRRQGALRRLPGAVPDQRRASRRLRPLRQRRRHADAHGPGACWCAARGGESRGPGPLGPAAGTARCSHEAPVFVSGIGSGTTYPDYKPAPFIVASQASTASTWSRSSPRASSATAASR